MDVLLRDTCGQRGVACLLFTISFWVVKATGDCPRPEGGPTFVLTTETLLMNEFPEGTTASLACAYGYVYEGGSAVINCIDQKWSEPELKCKKKDCGPPKPQPNMIFNITRGTRFGDKAGVTCDKGYYLTGVSVKTCYTSGWHGRTKCEIVTCEKPAEITNGRMTWSSEDYSQYGGKIHFTCNEGYTLVGKDGIMCTETGEYDSDPPECRDLTTEMQSTATVIIPTSQPQEAATFSDSTATPTIHRTWTVRTSATSTTSSSLEGDRGIAISEKEATPTSDSSAIGAAFQDSQNEVVDTNNRAGNVAVIVTSIVAVTLVLVAVAAFYKLHARRKGSYETGEGLKFQTL